MPTKSTGCAKCRKRKIRCDEGRPGCNRCRTYGVPCPGYRDPAPGEVLFQDQTEWTVARAHERYGTVVPKSGAGVLVSSSAVLAPFSMTTAEQERSTSITNDVMITSFSFSSPSEWNGSAYDSAYETPSTTPDPADRYIIEQDEFGHRRAENVLDFAAAMEKYATPQHFPAPAVEKALIYHTFLDTYLPKSLPHRQERDAHFSIFEHLITTPGLRPEVRDSLDALSLVQVGSIYKDKALLKQAVGAYSRALTGLVRTLSARDFVQDDYVLATCTILSTCEFYDEIADVGDGWSKHVDGSAQLLQARGPDSLKSDLALLLYSNMRHAALSHALIARKRCFLGRPEWRAVAWRTPVQDRSTIFYDSALQIPAILERYDRLDFDDAEGLEGRIDGVLEDALALEQVLRDWFDDLQIRSRFRNARDEIFWRTEVSNFPVFASLCSNRALDEAYMFPGFMVAYLLSVYWTVMFFLRSAIQNLQMARHKAMKSWFPDPQSVVTEEELLTYVMDICRCFPFFCEPSSSATGQIGMFLPTYLAGTYFVRRGHWRMLKWLGDVKDNVFTKGMRPPNVKATTPAGVSPNPMRW